MSNYHTLETGFTHEPRIKRLKTADKWALMTLCFDRAVDQAGFLEITPTQLGHLANINWRTAKEALSNLHNEGLIVWFEEANTVFCQFLMEQKLKLTKIKPVFKAQMTQALQKRIAEIAKLHCTAIAKIQSIIVKSLQFYNELLGHDRVSPDVDLRSLDINLSLNLSHKNNSLPIEKAEKDKFFEMRKPEDENPKTDQHLPEQLSLFAEQQIDQDPPGSEAPPAVMAETPAPVARVIPSPQPPASRPMGLAARVQARVANMLAGLTPEQKEQKAKAADADAAAVQLATKEKLLGHYAAYTPYLKQGPLEMVAGLAKEKLSAPGTKGNESYIQRISQWLEEHDNFESRRHVVDAFEEARIAGAYSVSAVWINLGKAKVV